MGLKDFSWNVSEPEYRKGEGLSYSTLSTLDRDGLPGLESIIRGDKKSSASLTFGSIVDTLLTEEDVFFDKFVVSKCKYPSDKIKAIVLDLYDKYKRTKVFSRGDISSLDKVPIASIIESCDKETYYVNFTDDRRASYIVKDGSQYYEELINSENKQVISSKDYNEGLATVRTLKSSKFFSDLFASKDYLLSKGIEILYQTKFKLDGEYNVRCMFDIIKVDHVNRQITPIDLKTTGHTESDFRSSFYMWRYYLQSSLYSHILRESIIGTPYEGFEILPFRFLVINRYSLSPRMFVDGLSINDNATYSNLGNTMKTWRELYNEAKYAIDNNNFKYEKDVLDSNGVVNLN